MGLQHENTRTMFILQGGLATAVPFLGLLAHPTQIPFTFSTGGHLGCLAYDTPVGRRDPGRMWHRTTNTWYLRACAAASRALLQVVQLNPWSSVRTAVAVVNDETPDHHHHAVSVYLCTNKSPPLITYRIFSHVLKPHSCH